MMGYNPGERSRRFKQGYRITKNRVAWARVAWGSLAMMKYADLDEINEDVTAEDGVQEESYTEPGPTIRIVINKNGTRRPVTLDLTMLTAEELTQVRSLFMLACDAALPVCQFRDEEAQKAHAKGDDSYTRLYRGVPQFIVREGSGVEHLESLRNRLASNDLGVGTDSGGTLREGGTGVDQPVPDSTESKDDSAPTDLDPSVRQVGTDTDA